MICFRLNIFIKGSPIKKTIIKEVITDRAILTVIYLKTFKNEYCSTRDEKDYKAYFSPAIIFLDKLFKPVAFEPLIIK